MKDNVNHPGHYTEMPFKMKKIECIDFSQYLNFCRGNAFKYVWRAGLKGDEEKELEDLKKALWYINREKSVVSIENPYTENAEKRIRCLWDLFEFEENNYKFFILGGLLGLSDFDFAKQALEDKIKELENRGADKNP